MRFFAFILKAKTNNHYHITLKITELNGTIKFIETPLIILPEEWDVVKLCPNNLYNEKSKILNKKLNRIKIEVANYFQELEKTEKPLSMGFLKKSITKICANSTFSFKPETLLFYMYSYIKEREYTVAVSTYRRNMVFLNLFEKFEAYRLKNIMLEDVNSNLVKEFYEFGKIEKYSENTGGCRCLSFIQQKTKKKILLPLHPVVEEVLSRNESNFPAKISVEKYNAQIKEIVKTVGINDHVLVNIREGHRSSHMTVPKWKAVSSHIGRRSFATNFYGKIPTSLLIEATGHSSEAMFQKYVNRLNEEHIKELSGYFHSTHKKVSPN